MNIRCFPAAAIAAATLTVWFRLAPAVAQELSTPQAPPGTAPARSPVPLSSGSAEILKLSRAKVSDEVTVAFIQNGDRRYALSASEILYLRNEGVSDRVLTTMLNPQSRASESQTPPPAAAPASDVPASAPQYVAPSATTVVEQTSPATPVYVAESTPTYYSFYDPWPYRYDPWPYYYPYFSLGFYWGWGGCYSGYWNNYCHNGYYGGHYGHNGHNGYYGHNGSGYYGHNGNHHSPSSHAGGQMPGGQRPNGGQPRNGNPPPHNGGSRPGGQPGKYTAGGSLAGGGSQPRSAAVRPVGTPPTGRPTSNWSGNGNPSTTTRGGQPNVVASRGTQAGGATRSLSGNPIIAGPRWGQAGTQPSRAAYVSRGATVGSATASAPGVWNRPGGQMGNRYAGSPASSPQRIAGGSTSSYRAGGNFVSPGRPSMGSSYGGAMNGGGFRGGGNYGGGGAPRMSSGGGYHGGGGSRGGGGGGSRR